VEEHGIGLHTTTTTTKRVPFPQQCQNPFAGEEGSPRWTDFIIPTNKITQMKLAHKLVTSQLLNSCVFFTVGVHARGDFMVHLAGLDDKKKWIRQVLQDLRGEKFDERTTQEKGTTLTMSRKESLPFRQWWKY
jgi:hypothetical protein